MQVNFHRVGCFVRPTGEGRSSAGRVWRYTDLVCVFFCLVAIGQDRLTWVPESRHSFCVCYDRLSSSHTGSYPQALTLFGRDRFIALRLRHTFLDYANRARGIFGTARHVWGTVLRLNPPLKRPGATLVRLVGRMTDISMQIMHLLKLLLKSRVNLEWLYRELFMLISWYVRMMLFRIENLCILLLFLWSENSLWNSIIPS